MIEDDPLAEFEEEYEGGEPEVEEEELEPEVEEESEEVEGDDSPPGFKSYEEYVADGGDPDMYRGKKAFAQQYESIQKNNELKGELSDLKTMTKKVMSTVGDWKEQQRANIRAELEAELEEQKRTADVDGALETKDKLAALDAEENEPETERQINPVVKQFMEDNPILDENSESFNAEFFDDMARIQANYINELSGNGGADLTDAQVQKCTNRAFERAKELNPELFRSRRNDRQGASRQGKGGQRPDKDSKSASTRIKDFKLDTLNPDLNSNAASEIMELIAEQDPEMAESFANKVMGAS